MSNPTASGLLGLDRKAMEEERLRRNALKRTADQAAISNDERPHKMAGTLPRSNAVPPTSAKPSKVTLSGNNNLSPSGSARPQPSHHVASKDSKIEYPRGAVKKTWAFGHERANDIKIEEVLQRSSLTTAVISSWQWDFDWLLTKIDHQKTKTIFVMEAKTPAEKDRLRGEFKGLEKVVRLCFPPMSNNMFARMHSKLMLLFHPSHLRIVIPSANPVRHDWGEGGVIENTVFLIDLPRHAQNDLGTQKTLFQKEFLHFLDAMELPKDVIEGIHSFDFSNTTDLAFIHSIPGSYNHSTNPSGLACLSTSVKLLNLTTPPGKQLEVDFASASVGSLDKTQIAQFCTSLRGLDPREPHEGMTGKASSGSRSTIDPPRSDSFRLIYPSEETVNHSKDGPNGAGTIFLKTQTFDKPTFPRDILREYTSTRKGLLSHNKIILVRSPTSAYVYTGSANLSQSAWGRLSQPKGSQEAKLTITNWECGVLVPVKRVSGGESEEGVMPYSVFEGVLSVPFSCPARGYREGLRPWLRD